MSDKKVRLPYWETCSFPAATKSGNDITYNLDDIITPSECEGRGFHLSFSADSDSVEFYCSPRSTELRSRMCSQSIEANKTYHFTFGQVDGTEKVVDVRSIPPVARDCVGQEITLLFSGDDEEMVTMCDNGGGNGKTQGFGRVRLSYQKGHITFTTK